MFDWVKSGAKEEKRECHAKLKTQIGYLWTVKIFIKYVNIIF